MLRGYGAEVIEADAVSRALMEPGQTVYAEIVRLFGREAVSADGRLDRARLAELAFQDGRLNELNAIVHPAVIEVQQHWMDKVFEHDPAAVAVVESALIFEVARDAHARGETETVLADWRRRVDRIVVVTAPDELKIARYVARVCPVGPRRKDAEADARTRLALQIPDAEKVLEADYIIENSGNMDDLRAQVIDIWRRLKGESNYLAADESLK
jgi:dephospho-CoA kinase